MPEKTLRIGLPTGSLMDQTLSLFAKAGFTVSGADRSYRPSVDDPELVVRLLRAQEISRYVEQGFLDCGITGRDWVAENASDVASLCDLPYSKVSSAPTRWVVVVPEDSPVRSVEDLAGKRVATEAVGLTKEFFRRRGVSAEVELEREDQPVTIPPWCVREITGEGAFSNAALASRPFEQWPSEEREPVLQSLAASPA